VSALARRQQRRGLLPDIDDMFDSVFPFAWRLPFDQHAMRIEEYVEDGHEVVRAELPGMDPDKDVEVTVREGVLTIKAERSERKSDKGRSEFRYGSFLRRVLLPAGADESDVTATYDNGILTVRIAVKEPETSSERHIKVDH
jgi:HSP20 family protein